MRFLGSTAIVWALDVALVGSTLIAIAVCFAAIGAFVRQLLGGRTRTLDDGFLSFWVGFAAVTWCLILWNFWFPIDATALFALMFVAAVCCASAGGQVLRAARENWTRRRTGGAIVVVLVALWVAGLCLGPFRSWDGVLYHIQGVAWAHAYPVIPGIANLDARLAFNNSSFLYDALIDSWIWEGRGFHIANGTLLFVSVLQGLTAGLRWRGQGPGEDRTRLFEFLLVPIALYYTPEASTYSTDLPMALTLSAALARAYAVLEASSDHARPISRETRVVLALLFGTAIAMKLTAGVFAATALAVLVWRRPGWAWSWSALAGLVFMGPWVARGVLMSGYPFFPLPYLGLPVDWRAPLEHARGELAYIGFTERGFSWHFVGRAWVYLIFVRNVGAILLPALLSAIAFVLWWRLKGDPQPRGPRAREWWLAAPALAGIAAWLPSAPSERYGAVLFWALAAVSASVWISAALRTSRIKPNTAWVAAVAIALSPLIASSLSTLLIDGASAGIVSVRRSLVGLPEGGLPALPTDFPVQTFVTRSGLKLNIPRPRANMRDLPDSCGNASLPCTPTPADNLELRHGGSLERGFRIRGDWNMTEWPYRWRPTFLEEWRARQKPDR